MLLCNIYGGHPWVARIFDVEKEMDKLMSLF
jgi:hypothetical protein